MGGPVVSHFKGSVLWRFDVGFDISLNKLLNKQTTGASPNPEKGACKKVL